MRYLLSERQRALLIMQRLLLHYNNIMLLTLLFNLKCFSWQNPFRQAIFDVRNSWMAKKVKLVHIKTSMSSSMRKFPPDSRKARLTGITVDAYVGIVSVVLMIDVVGSPRHISYSFLNLCGIMWFRSRVMIVLTAKPNGQRNGDANNQDRRWNTSNDAHHGSPIHRLHDN